MGKKEILSLAAAIGFILIWIIDLNSPTPAEVKGQFVRAESLEDRQHPAAGRSVDEVVGVFDARCNALEVQQLTDRVVSKPSAQFGAGHFGEDGHCISAVIRGRG